tara:strand:+ start:411 stop:752 length:342 start_codon:yes stop_codon:yes gene_type:complete
MKPDTEFAEGVYTIITGFMDGAKSVKSLESYYLTNKKAIATMRVHSEEHYQKLIQSFKEAKDAINTNRLRQEHTDKVAGGEGQRATEQEDQRSRKERARKLSESHPSARFWKR